MKKFVYTIFCFFLVGCKGESSSSCETQVKKSMEKLTRSFEEIQSKEDFKVKQQVIKKEFDQLAKSLMILRKENLSGQQHYQIVSPDQQEKFDQEFSRVMAIDGCKELYEQATIDALYLLDAFEQKLQFPQFKQSRLKKFEED
jgi:hypothetical protein